MAVTTLHCVHNTYWMQHNASLFNIIDIKAIKPEMLFLVMQEIQYVYYNISQSVDRLKTFLQTLIQPAVYNSCHGNRSGAAVSNAGAGLSPAKLVAWTFLMCNIS